MDSLQDMQDSPETLTTGNIEEEGYTGEVLILNQENILKIWDEYASRIPEEKKGLRISFSTFKPVLDTATLNKLLLKVQSDVQRTQFDEFRMGIQTFISKRVGANITLEILADKVASTGSKPYTPKEKLEYLIQKNPAIKKMQQQFGLELDYD